MTGKRPYIGMYFACCSVYTRVYLNRQGTAFLGYCPRCGRPVRVRVGKGGSRSRFWSSQG